MTTICGYLSKYCSSDVMMARTPEKYFFQADDFQTIIVLIQTLCSSQQSNLHAGRAWDLLPHSIAHLFAHQ